MTTVLQTYGLGVMLFSPSACRDLTEGDDYGHPGALDHLVDEHRIVFLGTGSPELTYEFTWIEVEGPLDATSGVSFGLRVADNVVCIRDGYAVMNWNSVDPNEIRFECPSDYYHLNAQFALTRTDADVHIQFQVARNNSRHDGDGWPYLEYVV